MGESTFKKYQILYDFRENPSYLKAADVESPSEEDAQSEFELLFQRLGTPIEVFGVSEVN